MEKNEKNRKNHPTNSRFFEGQKRMILPKIRAFGEDQVYPSRGSRQTLAAPLQSCDFSLLRVQPRSCQALPLRKRCDFPVVFSVGSLCGGKEN